MKTYQLTLDNQDLQVIAAGLGELPLKVSKAVWDKIEAQVAQINKPPAEPPSHGGTD